MAYDAIFSPSPMKGKRFQKGVSGNPGGRPKEVKEVIALAREEGPESIKALARIRDTGKDERAVVAAAIALLDRGCGKPTQMVHKTVEHIRTPREMDLGELERRLEQLRGAGAEPH